MPEDQVHLGQIGPVTPSNAYTYTITAEGDLAAQDTISIGGITLRANDSIPGNTVWVSDSSVNPNMLNAGTPLTIEGMREAAQTLRNPHQDPIRELAAMAYSHLVDGYDYHHRAHLSPHSMLMDVVDHAATVYRNSFGNTVGTFSKRRALIELTQIIRDMSTQDLARLPDINLFMGLFGRHNLERIAEEQQHFMNNEISQMSADQEFVQGRRITALRARSIYFSPPSEAPNYVQYDGTEDSLFRCVVHYIQVRDERLATLPSDERLFTQATQVVIDDLGDHRVPAQQVSRVIHSLHQNHRIWGFNLAAFTYSTSTSTSTRPLSDWTNRGGFIPVNKPKHTEVECSKGHTTVIDRELHEDYYFGRCHDCNGIIHWKKEDSEAKKGI